MQTTSSGHRLFQADRTSAVMCRTIAVILLGALALSLLAASPVTAQGGAVVKVDPASSTVEVGATVVVNIRIENVTNLAGAEVHLTYDPFMLEAQSIQAGGFPAPDYVLQSSATGGKIDYAIAQMPPHTPVSGSGVLLKITFKGLAKGTNPLHMLSAVLSDGGGTLIPSTTQDGSVTIIPPEMRIMGRVLRQGVPPSTGPGTLKCTRISGPGAVIAYTNEAGDFELPVPSEGSYTVRASYPGYLTAQKTDVFVSGGQVAIGTTKLLGGDVNGDNIIDILDIVIIINGLSTTGHPVRSSDGCESPDSLIDINDDSIVNVSDLAIATGNFGKSGPTPWAP